MEALWPLSAVTCVTSEMINANVDDHRVNFPDPMMEGQVVVDGDDDDLKDVVHVHVVPCLLNYSWPNWMVLN